MRRIKAYSKNLQENREILKRHNICLIIREIDCRESEGFRHIQSECPNFIQRHNRNMVSTLSDEESDDEIYCENVKNSIAFPHLLCQIALLHQIILTISMKRLMTQMINQMLTS